MNKTIMTTTLVGCLLLCLACGKEEFQDLIVGEWEITRYQVDGLGDLTETNAGIYTEINFEFKEEGDIEQYWKVDSMGITETFLFEGEYEIEEDELDLQFTANSASNFFTGNPGGNREVYEIEKLEQNDDGAFELELDGIFNGRTVEICATKID